MRDARPASPLRAERRLAALDSPLSPASPLAGTWPQRLTRGDLGRYGVVKPLRTGGLLRPAMASDSGTPLRAVRESLGKSSRSGHGGGIEGEGGPVSAANSPSAREAKQGECPASGPGRDGLPRRLQIVPLPLPSFTPFGVPPLEPPQAGTEGPEMRDRAGQADDRSKASLRLPGESEAGRASRISGPAVTAQPWRTRRQSCRPV